MRIAFSAIFPPNSANQRSTRSLQELRNKKAYWWPASLGSIRSASLFSRRGWRLQCCHSGSAEGAAQGHGFRRSRSHCRWKVRHDPGAGVFNGAASL